MKLFVIMGGVIAPLMAWASHQAVVSGLSCAGSSDITVTNRILRVENTLQAGRSEGDMSYGALKIWSERDMRVEKRLAVQDGNKSKIVFFLPNLCVMGSIIEEHTERSYVWGTLSVQAQLSADGGQEGLIVSLVYDAAMVLIEWDLLSDLLKGKGFMIRVINKKLFEALQSRESPVLCRG